MPLEAMAAGRPVVAYGSGGALDTVIEGETGVFFHEQTADALQAAMERCESLEAGFDPHRIRRHARAFGGDVFRETFRAFVASAMHDLSGRSPPPILTTTFAEAAE